MKTILNQSTRPADLTRRIIVLEEQMQELLSKKLDYPDSSDVCRQLHVSKRELAYLRESGKLPYFKVGKKILFDPADIRGYIASTKVFKNCRS